MQLIKPGQVQSLRAVSCALSSLLDYCQAASCESSQGNALSIASAGKRHRLSIDTRHVMKRISYHRYDHLAVGETETPRGSKEVNMRRILLK
jgi:hypothetical protein